MAKNRIRPYGYKIEGGKTAIDPREAEVIRRIYREYAAGRSYKSIAQALSGDGIHYMPDKPLWNKNMVARILQNVNYLGTDKYPAILGAAESRLARQARKPYTHTESADVKALKPLLVCGVCGEPVKRRLKTDGGERWYCPADTGHIGTALTDEALLQSIEALQGRLAAAPGMAVGTEGTDKQIDITVIRLQNEIDQALTQPEPDHAAIEAGILSLAAQKYALCRDREDDMELAEQISRMEAGRLDSAALKAVTARIIVEHTRAIALVLKNGQTIQPAPAGKGEDIHE